MKDFNIAKYLKENHLGSHSILGRYVDLHALKEEEVGNNKPVSKVPYEGSDAKLDGFGDKFNQVDPVSELEKPEKIYADKDSADIDVDRMMMIGGDRLESSVADLIDDGFDPEDILEFCQMAIEKHTERKSYLKAQDRKY